MIPPARKAPYAATASIVVAMEKNITMLETSIRQAMNGPDVTAGSTPIR